MRQLKVGSKSCSVIYLKNNYKIDFHGFLLILKISFICLWCFRFCFLFQIGASDELILKGVKKRHSSFCVNSKKYCF